MKSITCEENSKFYLQIQDFKYRIWLFLFYKTKIF